MKMSDRQKNALNYQRSKSIFSDIDKEKIEELIQKNQEILEGFEEEASSE